MTPGERAFLIFSSEEGIDAVRHGDILALERLVTTAIREAVAAERERRATIADQDSRTRNDQAPNPAS